MDTDLHKICEIRSGVEEVSTPGRQGDSLYHLRMEA